MPAMRRNDRSGPGIMTLLATRGGATAGPGDAAPGSADGEAAGTAAPEGTPKQTHRPKKTPATQANERREDIIAEHLFKALKNIGWQFRSLEWPASRTNSVELFTCEKYNS